MSDNRVSSVLPGDDSVEIGGVTYKLIAPNLNVLADLEEQFNVPFTRLQDLLDPNMPGFFKNIRFVLYRMLLEGNPELLGKEMEIGAACSLTNIEPVLTKVMTAFGKGMPAPGEAQTAPNFSTLKPAE